MTDSPTVRAPAPGAGSARAEPQLVGVGLFQAGAEVRNRITVDVHHRSHPVSPLSAGFVALRAERLATDSGLAADALRLGRPVALVGPAGTAAASLARQTASHRSMTRQPQEVHFLVPDSFVTERTAAIHRRQDPRPPRGLPAQRVTALGIGARPSGLEPAISRALARAGAVVGTDWTFATTLPAAGLHLPTGTGRHAVPYDIDDYDHTIRGFDRCLTDLQRAGIREVALLVEGNPDTLDVLDGIGLTGRTVEVVPGIPVAIAAAWDLDAFLSPRPFGTGLAYLSGLPNRHGQSTGQLLDELTRYLVGGLSCVLVEMTYSDLTVAAEAVRRAPGPKTVVVLADYSSDRARTRVTHAPSPDEVHAVIARGRGVLSTVLIFDDPDGSLAEALR
jgi:hypothetical protein